MSMNQGSFRPDELVGSDAEIPDSERAASYAAARELEQALSAEGIHPSAGFTSRVMTAVALEPAPHATGFLAPLRARHSLAGVVASVRAAWVVAMGGGGGGGRPVRARGLALAYVLAVLLIGASLTGLGAFGAAGAIGLLTPDETPRPSLVEPGPTPSPGESFETTEPSESAEPSESTEASGSPDASESAEPSESNQPEDSSGPDATSSPRSSDDHAGDTPRPSSSDDHGDGATASPSSSEGSGGDSGSGSPTQSPKPSETPKSSD